MKSIFISAKFGYKKGIIDGQTLKSRILKDELEDHNQYKILFSDTADMKNRNIFLLIEIIIKSLMCKNIIILPAHKGLRILLPIFVLIRVLFNKNLRYVVIGGWLPEVIANNNFYYRLCKKIDGIYVETSHMKEKLNELGLMNVEILPNFKRVEVINNTVDIQKEKVLNLVFLSRVMKEKGIEEAIDVVTKINRNQSIKINLDIYGPINQEYEQFLLNYIEKNNKENIFYKGILQPNEIQLTLVHYDAMVFPTFYSGEGFPGIVLDAYMAGLPVIASDWRYNSEVIIENYTGFLFNTHSLEQLEQLLVSLANDTTKLRKIKKNCIEEVKKYDSQKLISEFAKCLK